MNEYDDTDLRATLGRHAEQAPPDGDLLTAVHRRSRGMAQRRMAITGGLTALVVAVAVVAVQNLAPGGGPGAGADAAQSSSAPPEDPPAAPHVKNPALGYRFPFTTDWEPSGFDNPYGVVVSEHRQQMGYLDTPGTPGSESAAVVLDLFDERPWNWPTEGQEIDVRGTTGTYLTAGGARRDDVLAWEENGSFFMLRTRDIERADMLTYAEGLKEGEGPGFLGARCGYGSRDFAPADMVEGKSLLETPDKFYQWTTVENTDYAVTPEGPTVTVDIIGGLQGVIATDEKTGDRVLVVVLRPDRAVAVHGHEDYEITDDALVYDALGFMLSEFPC